MNPSNPDCSGHKKDLFGKTDMKEVAEAIGDLNYETLQELFFQLSVKLYQDEMRDANNKRPELGASLDHTSDHIANAAHCMARAWKTSKKYMNETK